jgi:hypothetical protein
MDHNESPGSTTKRVVFSSVVVVMFCSASIEAAPVSRALTSWDSAMPGSPARIANATSAASATPATDIPTSPLRLALKMFPPYSERLPLPKT